MARYKNLVAELRRDGLRQQAVADVLGVTLTTANHKINGKYPFTLTEAFSIWRELFPTCDFVYLFETRDESA